MRICVFFLYGILFSFHAVESLLLKKKKIIGVRPTSASPMNYANLSFASDSMADFDVQPRN